MITRSSDLPAPFFDLAMGVVAVLMGIFLVTQDAPPRPQAGSIQPKAEFIISADWQDGSQDDIDLYVKGPDGKVVYFANKKTPALFLDNDNLGNDNTAIMPDGSKTNAPARREVVTIRVPQAGEYTVNAHAFRKRETAPAHVRLIVTKINPYAVVTTADADLAAEGDEVTLASFSLDAAGRVTSVYLVPVKMVGR